MVDYISIILKIDLFNVISYNHFVALKKSRFTFYRLLYKRSY